MAGVCVDKTAWLCSSVYVPRLWKTRRREVGAQCLPATRDPSWLSSRPAHIIVLLGASYHASPGRRRKETLDLVISDYTGSLSLPVVPLPDASPPLRPMLPSRLIRPSLTSSLARPISKQAQAHAISGARCLTTRNFPVKTPPRAPPHTKRSFPPLHSRLDPVTVLLAAVLSTGVAYIFTQYTTTPTAVQQEAHHDWTSIAPSAQQYYHVMAPAMPPGRPGNLTAEQETKLKEMWVATLDVFGVTHEKVPHTNGAETPTSDNTPDAKKKKKSRLSVFKSKDKQKDGDSNSSDPVDNDKHGQKQEFQQALASQSPEDLRDAFWSMSKHDHPDALLLRFLRARKWDVQAALVMLISTMHWRSEDMHVDDDIMKNGEGEALRESKSDNAAEKKEGADFMAQLRMGKSFLHGVDKDGRPCCVVRVRLHRQGEQSERSLERFTVYTIETARMLLRPPVDTAVSCMSSAVRSKSTDTQSHRPSYST